MCFNFQKVSKSRDRHGDMTADDVMWVGRAVRKGRCPLRSSKLLGPRGLALARTRARWFRINMWALQACKCEIPLIWANSGDWVPNWKLLTEKKMYKFRVRCALCKDLTCNRHSLFRWQFSLILMGERSISLELHFLVCSCSTPTICFW